MTLSDRQRALARYYDAEAAAGVRSDLRDLRIGLHDQAVELFRRERVGTVLDVGTGTGLDATRFVAAGFRTVGVDLSLGNAVVAARAGVPCIVGSLFDLPISDDCADVVWTMSTLVHVGDDEIDRALSELDRVCRPGGLLVIGSWGSRDWEGTHDVTRFDPPRFFSLRRHDRWRTLLAAHGTVERYDTFVTDEPGWEYQFAVLRR